MNFIVPWIDQIPARAEASGAEDQQAVCTGAIQPDHPAFKAVLAAQAEHRYGVVRAPIMNDKRRVRAGIVRTFRDDAAGGLAARRSAVIAAPVYFLNERGAIGSVGQLAEERNEREQRAHGHAGQRCRDVPMSALWLLCHKISLLGC